MDSSFPSLAFDPSRHTLSTLSICDPQPKKLEEWVHDLPIANRGETAQQLYQALYELNQLICSASLRYELLEVVRPLISQVCDALSKTFLTKNVSLNEQQRKVANLTQALTKNLAAGYKTVAQQYINDGNTNTPYLRNALYRALQYLSSALLRSQQLYVSPPDQFWLDFNQLFAFAEYNELTDQPITLEDVADSGLKTINDVYAAALLFITCKPAQLRQVEQFAVFNALPDWVHFATLNNPADKNDLFIIRLNHNAPPIYQSFFQENIDSNCISLELTRLIKGFNASGLVDQLKNREPKSTKEAGAQSLAIPRGIDHGLMTHLVNAWGVMAKRTTNRKTVQGSLEICIGLSATHFYVSDGIDFDSQMRAGSLDTSQETNPFLNQKMPTSDNNADKGGDNAWSDAYKIPGNPLYDIELSKLTNAIPASSERDFSEAYPKQTMTVINASATGFCLQFKTPPAQLQSGEIIGIHNKNQAKWSVGAVRWVRHIKNHGMQIGVELLTHHAIVCGARLIAKSGDTSAYMRTLIVPALESTGQPQTLITPRIPFHEGSKIYLRRGETERRAQLTPLIAATGGFCQFKFHYLNEQVKN